jgi:hypothetical protein
MVVWSNRPRYASAIPAPKRVDKTNVAPAPHNLGGLGVKSSRFRTPSVATILFVGILLLAISTLHPSRAAAACIVRNPTPSASASPSPEPSEPPLYSMGDEIYTIDHDMTLYYYFQGNRDGSAKVKREFRYDRNLWNTCAQLQIRLPVITRYPIKPSTYSPDASPFTGFGNAELRYSYNVVGKTFDHSIAVGSAFPTNSNGVESIDTQLKLFYITKWKWKGGSISYTNEYDQTVIRPPGADYTSYYEGLVNVPSVSFVDSPAWKGLKLSAIYNFRVLFNEGSLFKSAVGPILTGNINDVALSVIDTWGIGPNGLWKYKVEASAVARLNF